VSTLNAIFRLQDNYTRSINKIMGSTKTADDKIKAISGRTDTLNAKLNKIKDGGNAGAKGIMSFVGSLKGLAAAYFSVQAAQRGMEIADTYTNTASRLKLINDGLQTNAELQDKIFQAADRSRGSYNNMAASISKMGMLAKDAFKSNDELIAFTELVQKSFKVGGSGTQEQQSGIYQLTQAMAAGKLQGDEFRSIMENAPMIADAVAKFTGKSKGKLKKMSAEGTITADVIKNAMFAMSGDINSKFDTMPKTFGDVWNQIGNKAIKAFSPAIEKISEVLNSPSFDRFIDNVIFGIGILSILFGGLVWFFGLLISNWSIVEPILLAIGIILSLWAFQQIPILITKLWGMLAPILVQAGAWLLVNWWILLIMIAVGLLLYAMLNFGEQTIKVFGFIGGAIAVVLTSFYNFIAVVWNGLVGLGEGIADVFINSINFVLKGVNWIIDALNMIPGINIGKFDSFGKADFGAAKMQYKDLGSAFIKGQNIGQNVGTFAVNGVKTGADKLSNLTNMVSGTDTSSLDKYMKNGALPVSGKDGNLKVDMSQEDLKYLQDIAEREYINKFSTATLAPNIIFKIAKVAKEVDADKLMGRLKKIMEEEIAIVAEGVYEA